MTSQMHPVLIVEDEDSIRENLQLLFELDGYAVLTASNGKEGLEQLRHAPPPCFVLLDLMMPVMNGEEFLKAKAAEESLASIPVCVFSGMANVPDLRGAATVLRKPLDLDRLLNLVQHYCGSSKKT